MRFVGHNPTSVNRIHLKDKNYAKYTDYAAKLRHNPCIPHDIEHTMNLFRTLQAVIQL